MIIDKIFNGIKNIIGGINDGLMLSGYSRTAIELRKLSDKRLAELGISKELLEKGAYPWREEIVSQEIPDNLTTLKTIETDSKKLVMPQTPKAA